MTMIFNVETAGARPVRGGFVFRADNSGGVYLAATVDGQALAEHRLTEAELTQLQALLAHGATGNPGPSADCLSLFEVAARFGLPQHEIRRLAERKLLDHAPLADHYTTDSVSRLSWQRKAVVDLLRKGGLGRSLWLNGGSGPSDLVKLANDLPLTVYQRGLVSLAITAAKGDSLAMPDMYFARLVLSLLEHYGISHLAPKCRQILVKLQALAKAEVA